MNFMKIVDLCGPWFETAKNNLIFEVGYATARLGNTKNCLKVTVSELFCFNLFNALIFWLKC